MKKLLTLITLTFSAHLFSQDTLFIENFNSGGPSFTLNTTDVGSVVGVYNTWVVNTSYTGGSILAPCPAFGMSLPVTISASPNQPVGITGNPNSGYMHITSLAGISSNVTNSHYQASDNLFCMIPGENHFARMNTDFSTVGYDTVTLKFWWLGQGTTGQHGEVYYSIDGGNSWVQITVPISSYLGQSNWVQQSITLPAFANLPTLRFGFRFVNSPTLGGSDPAFSIDDLLITGVAGGVVVTQNPVPAAICEDDTITFSITASNASSYQWQAFTGGNWVNIPNVAPYSGVNTPTLTIGPTSALFNGSSYRCIASGTLGSDTSNAALLVVNSISPFTISTIPVQPSVGVPVTFNVSITIPNPGTIVWDFCDGGTSNVPSPTHTYSAPATYNNCPCAIITDNNGCSRTVCMGQLQVLPTSGNENITNGVSFEMFPNPAQDYLNLVVEQGTFTTGSITDVTGKTVMTFALETLTSNQLPVGQLAGGTYILTLKGVKGSAARTFIKQ